MTVRTKLTKAALSATTLAFTLGFVGCAHAKTTQANENATPDQASNQAANQNQTQSSNQMSDQNAAQNADQNATPGMQQGTQQQEMMKFSNNGHTAIQASRVAIRQRTTRRYSSIEL